MEELRRGPWTVEEDLLLIKYVAEHGEGRWNALARCAGLKRTGKSCRLRWLNYLRPDVRRGNITPEEQLLILELHSRWGNRWSKIAQYLPGRTDNEIKNYWRTRVQKHAKQLHCDVNSKMFRDAMRYVWMPRLLERIQAASGGAPPDARISPVAAADPPPPCPLRQAERAMRCPERATGSSSAASSEDSLPIQFSTSFAGCYSATMQGGEIKGDEGIHGGHGWGGWTTDQSSSLSTSIPMSCDEWGFWDAEQGGWPSGDLLSVDYLWSLEDAWSMQQ